MLVTRGHQNPGRAQTYVSATESKSHPFPRGHQWIFLSQKWSQSLYLEGGNPPQREWESSDLQNLRPSCGWGPRRCNWSLSSWTWSCATCDSGRAEPSQLVSRAGAPPASSERGGLKHHGGPFPIPWKRGQGGFDLSGASMCSTPILLPQPHPAWL